MSALKEKMIELLEQDQKREYLELCRQNYSEAVAITQEFFPSYYNEMFKTMEHYGNYYGKALEMKKRGDVEGEIRVLETAIQDGTDLPICYERLATLYSKQKNYKSAYEVCMKWFDSVFWKLPQTTTSSLRLLDRLEKLKVKVSL